MRYADDAEELFLPVSCAEYFSLGQTIGTTSAALLEGRCHGIKELCPALHQNLSHLVAMEKASKSPIVGRRINAIANHRTWWQR